jgi:hypothetical protein
MAARGDGQVRPVDAHAPSTYRRARLEHPACCSGLKPHRDEPSRIWSLAMVVAALIVSLLALVVAVLSAVFTGIQAKHTRALAEIEASRRHDEQTPVLVAWIEGVNWNDTTGDAGWYRLCLRLESAEALDRLTAEVIGTDAVSFAPGQVGVDPTAAAHREPLQPGEAVCWRVELPERDRPRAMQRLIVRCHRAAATWSVLVEVEVPRGGRRSAIVL